MKNSSPKCIIFYAIVLFLIAVLNMFIFNKNEWHQFIGQLIHPQILPQAGVNNPYFFNPLVDLSEFVAIETSVTRKLLKEHIRSELARIEELRIIVDEYDSTINQYSTGTASSSSDSLNPLTSYLLIKRLIQHWEKINLQTIGGQIVADITKARMAKNVKYPGKEDLLIAALSLIHFQQIYQLKTVDLLKEYADNDEEFVSNTTNFTLKKPLILTAEDYYEIGLFAFDLGMTLTPITTIYFVNCFFFTFMTYAVEWLELALEQWEKDQGSGNNEPKNLEKFFKLLDVLAYSHSRLEHAHQALRTAQKLLELAPINHSNVQHWRQNVEFYRKEAENYKEGNKSREHPEETAKPQWGRYKQLCRGIQLGPQQNISKANSSSKPLYCYLKMDKPFLRLAPHKVELLHLRPLIAFFHGVISESEIEIVKQLSAPRLTRAKTVNGSGDRVYTQQWITKTAYISGDEHPAIAQLNKRIEDMTNLDMESAFDLRVSKYASGGHLVPHFDFTTKNAHNNLDYFDLEGKRGNRVASCIFYLSEPASGGRTIFTELGISFSPSKHDALFWYNLNRDGVGDLRTKHAGCQVLKGEKWILLKLINERGQEWIRPCPRDMDRINKGQELFVGDTIGLTSSE